MLFLREGKEDEPPRFETRTRSVRLKLPRRPFSVPAVSGDRALERRLWLRIGEGRQWIRLRFACDSVGCSCVREVGFC